MHQEKIWITIHVMRVFEPFQKNTCNFRFKIVQQIKQWTARTFDISFSDTNPENVLQNITIYKPNIQRLHTFLGS